MGPGNDGNRLPINMAHIDYLTFSRDEEGDVNGNTVQLLRTGTWNHPKYGKIVITEKTLDNLVHNFDEKVRGVDLAIDTEHKSDRGAKAWIRDVWRDDNKLMAFADWTNPGRECIQNGEYKYLSAEYSPLYSDTETGHTFRDVLLGAALTNRPFIKDMDPVLLSESVSSDEALGDFEIALSEGSDDYRLSDIRYDPNTIQFKDIATSPSEGYSNYRSSLKEELQVERSRRQELERELASMQVQGEVSQLIEKEGRVHPRDRRLLSDLLVGNDAEGVRQLVRNLPRSVHLSEIGSRVAPDNVFRTTQKSRDNINRTISLVEEEVYDKIRSSGKEVMDWASYRQALKEVIHEKEV